MKQSGVFEMLAAMAICGTIGITVLMSGQSEVSLIFYRCFFGALVLLAICLLRGYISASILKPRLIAYSLVGGAALLANWYFLFAAYEKTSIGVATTVYNTQPIIMIVLGFLVFKERITANIALWTAVSLTGLFFISNLTAPPSIDAHGAGSPAGNSVDARYFLGVLQALAAASLYAVAALFARLLKGNPPTLIALLQMVLGAVVLWPFADFGGLLSQGFNRQAIATVLLGVFHTGVMYILLYGALQKLEASQAASISFLYPALAIFIDSTFLDVKLSLHQYVGIAMILLGAAGINLKWNLTAALSTRRTLANDRNSGS